MTKFSMFPEGLIPYNRTVNRGQQTRDLAREGDMYTLNRTDSIYRQHLRQPSQGLADWFVAKHTTDEVLFRQVLSRHGFKTPGHEMPRVIADQTEVSTNRI